MAAITWQPRSANPLLTSIPLKTILHNCLTLLGGLVVQRWLITVILEGRFGKMGVYHYGSTPAIPVLPKQMLGEAPSPQVEARWQIKWILSLLLHSLSYKYSFLNYFLRPVYFPHHQISWVTPSEIYYPFPFFAVMWMLFLQRNNTFY